MPTCSFKVAALITFKKNWANLGVTTFGFYLNTLEGIWLSLATHLFIQGRERDCESKGSCLKTSRIQYSLPGFEPDCFVEESSSFTNRPPNHIGGQ